MNRDPITNQPLPATAIQRVLFIAQNCHIYRIPPPSSPRYLTAALWTTNPADNFFTGRLRVVETALPTSSSSSVAGTTGAGAGGAGSGEAEEKVTATILIEDTNTGDLFAAAPYNHATVVTQATDSSRFFAIRVVGEGGMKATLGLGFEERPVAFDFSIALQDVRRTLGMDVTANQSGASAGRGSKPGGAGSRASQGQQQQQEEFKRDLSLKEGEMITIKIGGKGRRVASQGQWQDSRKSAAGNLFAIAPPPGSSQPVASGSVPILSPPPATTTAASSSAAADDDGFDDGEFGEFQ